MDKILKLEDDDGDLPEDFFDEFSTAEFIDGLNVVDSWNDGRPRPSEEDLRDLLRSRKEEAARDRGSDRDRKPRRSRDRERGKRSADRDNTKAGSRRDVDKTNRDIRKDKESKVKEYLAKRLGSEADIGPPGTELDDYMKDTKKRDRKHSPSPQRKRRSPSPLRRRSPYRRRAPPSPVHRRHSPLSPVRRRPRRSRTRTPTPLRDRRRRRSRSRGERRSRSPARRSRSRSRSIHNLVNDPFDNFLYQGQPPVFFGGGGPPVGQYPPLPPQEAYRPPSFPPQGYPNTHPHPEGFYPPGPMPGPQPPFFQDPNYYGGGPMGAPVMAPMQPMGQYYEPPAPPLMVPAPLPVPPPAAAAPQASLTPPLPAPRLTDGSLDQLLADGKISREDYLKLTPKGRPTTTLDLKEKVNVLTRCHDAVTKLAKLHLPNRLIMSNLFKIAEQKSIAPKFCSPLKRQPLVVFNFTSANSSALQAQNKHLVDSIIATIGLQQVIAKPSKKDPTSKCRDVAVQTTNPFCENCEIRQLTKCNDKGTSIDSDHFSTSVHTQVIEVELASSKTMFTPGGNVSETGGSIAHLTPAQLIVSQLAARAKKLEHSSADTQDDTYQRRAGNSYNPYYSSQNQGSNHYDNNYRY